MPTEGAAATAAAFRPIRDLRHSMANVVTKIENFIVFFAMSKKILIFAKHQKEETFS